jgi:hypothetical protein
MTGYELGDMFNSTAGLVVSILAVYLTFTSAYLVAAFVSGSSLTTSQCVIVSVLYLVAAGICVIAMPAATGRAVWMADQLRAMETSDPIAITSLVQYTLFGVTAMGIVASFKFMWDVRHPKNE